MIQTLGLIGEKLEHSMSPMLFYDFFNQENIQDWEYVLQEVKSLKAFVNRLGKNNWRGFNVTIPFKEAIMPLLDFVSEEAEAIGAVNTVKVVRNEGGVELYGYNTDAYGFEATLFLNDLRPKNCLVLGTGGASKAVQYVLKKLDIHYELVSRTGKSGAMRYSEVKPDVFVEFDTVINTTPLGMYPAIETLPDLPYHVFAKNQVAIDLVYNPEQTLFLGLAAANKARTINGMQMLQAQAEKAWEIFKS